MSISAPTVTGYSGFWLNEGGLNGAATPYAMLFHRASTELRMATLSSRPGFRAMRELLETLIGANVGAAAADSYARVSAPDALASASQLGGLRTIETVTTVDRITATADKSYFVDNFIKKRFIMNPAIASYPTDASGNGGGGKLGQ